ncbi:MAG: carboxypeptidase-like regulatory domain-containing protein [Polyangiaceae bacterium]
MGARILPRFALALTASALISACDGGPSGTGGDGGAPSSGGGGTTSSSTTPTTAPTTTSSTTTPAELPDTFGVKGLVTDGSAPIEGAIVMQAGGVPAFTTGADGTFEIELTKAVPGVPTVVAAKLGYRSRGVEFFELPQEDTVLELLAAKPPDNPSYAYGEPGVGDPMKDSSTAVCGHCHTTFVKQFRTSAHAKATKDPLVQDLYAGATQAASGAAECAALGGAWKAGLVPGTASDAIDKCYAGGGVLPDLNPACGAPGGPACDDPALPVAMQPTAFGGCADCHAPGILGAAGGRDLHDAVGTAFDAGNHCDVCHKARDVDLSKPPGVAGALVLQRPHEKQSDDPAAKVVQVMFGPLPDVPNEFMGGSYQPKFSTSELCGACHEQHQQALVPGSALDPLRWPAGLPIHDTYAEWEGSTFNTPGTQCQACHMPPDETGLKSTVDVTNEDNASISFGFVRPPERLREHSFRGPLSGAPRLIDSALNLVLGVAVQARPTPSVTATVTVQNILAGHAIPTGEPMRSMLLVVRADGCNAAWSAVDGSTILDGGGALAIGVAGSEVTANGATLTWAQGALLAKPGMRVRVARATGAFSDYSGIGFFADPTLLPEDKGMPILAPAGEATVVTAANGALTLDTALDLQDGDVVYLGDALPASFSDGAISLALAGAAGTTFAKTLVDSTGARHVHHYRATDIASDNRIPPQGSQQSAHTFAIPAGCASGKVTATLLYRPVPADMARLRGWEAKDWVVAQAART